MAGKALYLIAAMERKQGIGYKNDLPWHLEREYAYFERMSTVTQQPNKMVIISAYFLINVNARQKHAFVLPSVKLKICRCWTVFRIHDILVWIRILLFFFVILKFFCLLLFEGTLTSFFEDKKSKRSHKTVGIKVF
jgi:hypothetical protein